MYRFLTHSTSNVCIIILPYLLYCHSVFEIQAESLFLDIFTISEESCNWFTLLWHFTIWKSWYNQQILRYSCVFHLLNTSENIFWKQLLLHFLLHFWKQLLLHLCYTFYIWIIYHSCPYYSKTSALSLIYSIPSPFLYFHNEKYVIRLITIISICESFQNDSITLINF